MKLGARGERLAERSLKETGYRILARNYKGPTGEVDLVAEDGDTVVFVEIKTRSSSAKAYPERNVNAEKQRRLTRTARMFLSAKKMQNRPARFDVVAITLRYDAEPEIEHFINAFPPRYG